MLTRPMEIAASLNPVTYLMEAQRSLVLDDLDVAAIIPGFIVVIVGALFVVALSVRIVNRYD
jgi:ABC-2 type transport system permease protein